MGRLIFRLKYVTDEEADEVRQLLDDNNIETYETAAGLFGTSVAGIWLKDNSQEQKARALLKDYGEQRSDRVRQELQNLREAGEVETFWQRCKSQPFRLLFAFAAITCILAFSIVPFVQFF